MITSALESLSPRAVFLPPFSSLAGGALTATDGAWAGGSGQRDREDSDTTISVRSSESTTERTQSREKTATRLVSREVCSEERYAT